MTTPDLPDPSDRLDSWKEIATFLGRTVRTVQRWEKTAGLPVRRGGPGRGAVVASKAEVTEWWQRRGNSLDDAGPEPPTGRTRTLKVVILGTAAASILIIFAFLTFLLIATPRRDTTPHAGAQRVSRVLAAVTSEGQAARFVALPGPPGKVTTSPDDALIYATLPDDRAVAVVDATTLGVVRTIPTVEDGWAIASAPGGKRLFVAGLAELAVVDLVSTTVDRIPLGGVTYDLQLSPDGRRLWIALAQAGLKVFDTSTRELTVWPTIGCPVKLAMNATGQHLYVSYQCSGPGGRSGHDAIEVFDASSGRSLATRSGLPLVGGLIAVSPDGQYLWADARDACRSAQYDRDGCPPGPDPILYAFRALTLEPLLTVRVPDSSPTHSLLFVGDGSKMITTALGVNVVNAALGHVEERWPLGLTAHPALTRDGSRVLAGAPDTKQLVVLPLSSAPEARDLGGAATQWTADGTPNDTVGGMHGTATAGLRYAPGRLGQAFAFDGATAAISFGKRIDVDLTDGPATMAAWIRPDRAGAMTILSRVSRSGWHWRLTADGRQTFCLASGLAALGCDGAGLIGRATIAPGAWHHVAVIKTADRLSLHVNGQLDAEFPLTDYQPPPEVDDEDPITRLGSDRNGRVRFSGLIDEFTMFRRALQSEELPRLMTLTTFQR